MLRRFAAHTTNYTIASVLITLAGLVSFPILTRILDVSEYGVMNLVATALALTVGLGKLGMQHATLRFYSEVKSGKRNIGLNAYTSTVVWGMACVGLCVSVAWAFASQWLPASLWNDERVRTFMLVTSGLILVRVVDSSLVNQLSAQERSGVLMIYNVVRRYFALALLLGVLFWVAGNLWGFFIATIVGEVIPVRPVHARPSRAARLHRRAGRRRSRRAARRDGSHGWRSEEDQSAGAVRFGD